MSSSSVRMFVVEESVIEEVEQRILEEMNPISVTMKLH